MEKSNAGKVEVLFLAKREVMKRGAEMAEAFSTPPHIHKYKLGTLQRE